MDLLYPRWVYLCCRCLTNDSSLTMNYALKAPVSARLGAFGFSNRHMLVVRIKSL
jgi:hypothetical protein